MRMGKFLPSCLLSYEDGNGWDMENEMGYRGCDDDDMMR